MNPKIFQIIGGYIKIVILILIILGTIIYVFFKQGGNALIQRWKTHNSNPLLMPFASVLGKNSSNNAYQVFYSKFKVNFSYMMKPLQYIMNIINKLLGNLNDHMNLFRTMLKPIRNFFTSAAETFYSKINNFSVVIVYYFLKMRDLLRRLSSKFRLTIYTLDAIRLSMRSIWAGPIGDVSRNWAYAYSIIGKFFCFSSDTTFLIKDINGHITCKPISSINIDDSIVLKSKKKLNKVVGMVQVYNNGNNLYLYKGETLSGGHIIFNNGKWVRVEKLGTKINTNDNIILYCPICESNNIQTKNGLVAKDYNEFDSLVLENRILHLTLKQLNKKPYHLSINTDILKNNSGLSGDTPINIENGMIENISKIKIGKKLETGIVLGIVCFKSLDNYQYSIGNITGTGRFIFEETTHFWNLLANCNNITRKIQKKDVKYYQLITSTGYFKVGNYRCCDFSDNLDYKSLSSIDNMVNKYLRI